MIIKKILNHNLVIALDGRSDECVLSGKGIGYAKKAGDEVDPLAVEKVFRTKEKGVAEKLSGILESIPLEYIRVGDEIINMAKRDLGSAINDKIYLTLIDHIYFAIERHNDGIDLANNLMWEMKKFYANEFSVGLKALDIIDKRLSIRLPEDEAAFIAFHLLNAGSPGSKLVPVQESVIIVREVFSIVEDTIGKTLDRSSHVYIRFLTHLKFLSMRILNEESPLRVKEGDKTLYGRLRTNYPRECECVEKIATFLADKYNHKMTDEEKSYLMIHIHSVIDSEAE